MFNDPVGSLVFKQHHCIKVVFISLISSLWPMGMGNNVTFVERCMEMLGDAALLAFILLGQDLCQNTECHSQVLLNFDESLIVLIFTKSWLSLLSLVHIACCCNAGQGNLYPYTTVVV